MAKSFMQMAEEAMKHVEGISAEEVQQRLEQDSNALIVDVRDAADIPSTGLATGALNVSLGMLLIPNDSKNNPRMKSMSSLYSLIHCLAFIKIPLFKKHYLFCFHCFKSL